MTAFPRATLSLVADKSPGVRPDADQTGTWSQDNLNGRNKQIEEAIRRLPGYATALGEGGLGSGLPDQPARSAAGDDLEVLLDAYFQPGKLPRQPFRTT